MATERFTLGEIGGHEYIRCSTCGLRSFHPADIANRYCGRCHAFHDGPAPALAAPPLSAERLENALAELLNAAVEIEQHRSEPLARRLLNLLGRTELLEDARAVRAELVALTLASSAQDAR